MKPFDAPQSTDRALSEGPIVLRAPMGKAAWRWTGPNGLRSALMAGIVLVSLLSCVHVMPAEGTGGCFSGGDGSAGNPYLIENVWELQNMSNDLDACYALNSDIDASDTATWYTGKGFISIGGSQKNAFTGVLDGRNHTISGLYIDQPKYDYQGLFGSVGPAGCVKNVALADCNVTGSGYIGGLVGRNVGAVANCHASGNVSGTEHRIGGLVGWNDHGTISDSYAAGNISGPFAVGGLVGFNIGWLDNSHYNIDDVHINGSHRIAMGGLFDAQYKDWASDDLSLDISEYDRTLVPSGEYYNVSSVQGLKDLMGFADSADYKFRLATDIDLSAAQGLHVPYLAAGFDGDNHTVSNLSIDLPNACIGLFGLIIESTVMNTIVDDVDLVGYAEVGGLAGYILRGNVSHCNVTGNVTGPGYGSIIGGLVGNNEYGTVSFSHASASVSGWNSVGGLVGHSSGTIKDSQATGTVKGGNGDIGGLLGYNDDRFGHGGGHGNVTRSHATGNVSGGNDLGGLVGLNYRGNISCSYSTGDVTGTEDQVGGLLGYTYGGNVTCCYATGNATGTEYVGGLVGDSNGTVRDSYSRGSAIRSSAEGGWFGGFMGINDKGKVINCYSTGMVIFKGSTNPTSTGFLGGGVNDNDFYEMVGDFWDNETSQQNRTVGNATGRNTTDMKTRSTFALAGWDFTVVWCIREGVTYPLLQWQTCLRADAGPDQNVDIGTLVIFNGSGSYDINGIENYTWTFNDGTARTLYGAQPTHEFESYGIFIVKLTVRNEMGCEAEDTMTIFVMEYVAPVAEAGPDHTVDQGALVAFDGTGSTDDVRVAGWTWTLIDGRAVKLVGSRPTHLFDDPGTFVVTLNVTDECGNWDTDTMTVTVNDTTPPEVDAGPDQTVDEDTVVAFDGTASRDNVGIVKHTWTFYDGAPVALPGARPNYTFANPGAFVVTLNITDAAGNWATDTTNVTVNDTTAPVAEAGPDQAVNESVDVFFNGTGSIDNLGIVDYHWTFLDGSPITLNGSNPTYRFHTAGTYAVTLNVTDAAGHWATDTMTVTVRDITWPIAEAGPDMQVDEGTVVTFDGGASSDNVGVVNHTWTFTDVSLVTLHGARPTYLFDNPGVFVVTLNVTDASGNWDTDTTTVVVNDITSPTAEAGPDLMIDEGSLVAFDGSGCSDNVGIANYSWSFTDGAPVMLHGIGPTHRFSTPGVFVVTLTIVDSAGHQGMDTMTITVSDITPPVADAGPDLTVDEGSPAMPDGSGSSDNVGIVNWTWLLWIDEGNYLCYNETPQYRLERPGTYIVQLTVKDAAGHSDSDRMLITVNDIIPPRAGAGQDQTIDEGTRLRFVGISSYDSGGIANYTWSFEYGGEDIALYGAGPYFLFGVPGLYPVELKVTDMGGHTDTDTMNVTVIDVRPPVADAGPDRTVDVFSLVTFDGRESSDTAGIANYSWTFRYGTGEIALYGASPSFTFEAPGVYTVTLNVTDAAGHWDDDSMILTVRDVTPPVAVAGPDRTVPAGSTVQLDGSLSKDDVGIGYYNWTFTYEGTPMVLNGATGHFAFDEGGVYEILLTVRDSSGNHDGDVAVITVVDEGRVTGTVLDERGRPVEGATVEVRSSDGKAHTASTVANGSFAIDVHHGPLTWVISKEGYGTISGNSSVDPMGTTALDLPVLPLERVEERGPATPLLLMALTVIATVVVAAALVLRRRDR